MKPVKPIRAARNGYAIYGVLALVAGIVAGVILRPQVPDAVQP